MAKVTPRRSSLRSIGYYDSSAEELTRLYESVSFARIHRDVLDLLPRPPAKAIDIGAGSGRDAAALADLGFGVTAVDPSPGLLAQARRVHRGRRIRWVEDALPALSHVAEQKFDLVLVSAVWMHLAPKDRPTSMRTLYNLLKPQGVMVLTLREGRADAKRSIFNVAPDEVAKHAEDAGLLKLRRVRRSDELGRRSIKWTTFAFTRD